MQADPQPCSFDTPPDRRHGDSIKWNRYQPRDVIPLWVADMDFAAPPAVISALHQRVEHGVFGYAAPMPSLIEAIQQHLQHTYGWHIEPAWLLPLPGLVSALNIVCRAVGNDGDGVISFTPVYPPFMSAPRLSGRQLLPVPLQQEEGRWYWDEAELARAITPQTRLLLLCNPHNPVGRVWSRAELQQLADFAERHDLIVCSDEIHAGLILDPELSHIPLATLGADIARRSITLMAPSKTWNLPGLGCAFAIVPDVALRRRLLRVMDGIVPHVNVLGYVACEAALRDGEAWRQDLLSYLRGNRDRVIAALHGWRGLQVTIPEATYLAWIDCRRTVLERPAAQFEQAGVGLSDGADFGAPGFVRLNFGCARSLLDEALQRMRAALGG